MFNVKDKEYIGVIKEGIDNRLDGRYLVHIRELMASDTSLKPIWAKNEVVGNRFSRWLDFDTKSILSSGSYQPLRAGMVVNVRFRSDSLESAYITNVVSYLPLVDKSEMRDSFYLLNKTVNGSWIYQDDSRRFTHIMHGNGSSNIVLDDDGVTIHNGMPIENGKGGVLLRNALSIGKSGTKMEFGNSSIILDETGISFKIGNTQMTLTEHNIKLIAEGSIEVDSNKSLKLKARDTHIEGSENLQLYSNVLRMTGNLQTAIVSNVVTLDSMSLTSVRSTGQVNVEGTVKTKITAPVLELTSLTNIYLDAPTMYLGAHNMTIHAPSLALSSSTLMMDGIINHGMGVASSLGTSMKSMNISLGVSTDAANMSLVTALGNNDVVTGIVNASLVRTIPGAAMPIGEILKPTIVPAKIGLSVSEKVGYITASNESYNQVVNDQFDGLRETHDLH